MASGFRKHALRARVGDGRLEAPRLGGEHGSAQRRDVVVPPRRPGRVGGGLLLRRPRGFDEAVGHEPLHQQLERAGAEPHEAIRPPVDLLDHAVAVARAIGQGQQDLKGNGAQR